MNLVLVGLRGSGKTTVGRLLATQLGWRFLDTDTIVQERAGKTIAELFAQGGEKLFRAREVEAVRDCAQQDRAVIACGGGVVLNSVNVSALQAQGFVVHLTADPAELWRRVSTDASSAATRPTLLANAKSGAGELAELARARAGAYANARHAEMPVGGRTPEEVASAILALMKTRGMLDV